ncbi:hypothetical protein [Actinoallomurus acaciae]|uniref:Uncharacterized protein n=1 Tax=Actinoallomurus acaciae TaxID=502577 RepID=A0ABV5YGX5_9ACTN
MTLGTGTTAPAGLGLRTPVRRTAAGDGKDSVHTATNTHAAAKTITAGILRRRFGAAW